MTPKTFLPLSKEGQRLVSRVQDYGQICIAAHEIGVHPLHGANNLHVVKTLQDFFP
jgi:hypothetical protein